jgi:hypothetical protein
MAIQIPPSAYARPTPNTAQNTANNGRLSGSNAPAAESQRVAGMVRSEPQSADKTAANILNFVQRGLQQLQAQGASDERIQQRLEAARSGIEKGYQQAQEMLDGMGLLDDELKQQIGAGRSLVDQGLEQLADNPNAQLIQSAPVQERAALSVSNQMSLEVMTREGDRVTVSFSQSSAASASRSSSGISMSSSAELGYQMTVEGSLSGAEKDALDALFADVNSLSEQFFAGDLGGAIEQAMQLGFDGQQLASLSLDLRQQASVSKQSLYPMAKPQMPTQALEGLQAPLAAYSEAYEQALAKANPLAEPAQTMRDMMSALLPEESRMPVWQAFSEGLDQALIDRQATSA